MWLEFSPSRDAIGRRREHGRPPSLLSKWLYAILRLPFDRAIIMSRTSNGSSICRVLRVVHSCHPTTVTMFHCSRCLNHPLFFGPLQKQNEHGENDGVVVPCFTHTHTKSYSHTRDKKEGDAVVGLLIPPPRPFLFFLDMHACRSTPLEHNREKDS